MKWTVVLFNGSGIILYSLRRHIRGLTAVPKEIFENFESSERACTGARTNPTHGLYGDGSWNITIEKNTLKKLHSPSAQLSNQLVLVLMNISHSIDIT